MYSDFIKKTLGEAQKIALDKFGRVSPSVKKSDNNQVLTEADLDIGKYIVRQIEEVFSSYNVIDEEAGVIDKKSEFTWVVDPIDGTSNFANGLPTYGIMIGLLKGGVPVAGGISLPSFNEIYVAEKGKGSFCNGEQVHVSKENELLSSLVAYQIDGHQENPELTENECKLLAKVILNIRNLRTTNSAFDAAMVANGKYGAILNKTSKIWDNVAQQMVVEEAGGVYTDFYGKPIDYSKPLEKAQDNFTYCAGAEVLHTQLTGIINQN